MKAKAGKSFLVLFISDRFSPIIWAKDQRDYWSDIFTLRGYMEQNPILIVDDDQEDLDLIQEVVTHLKITRPVKFFTSGAALQAYLLAEEGAPFLIICDVNLPSQDGFETKRKISEDKELKYKSVPFIYWSTDASEKQIQFAYDIPAQGFFFKPTNFDDLCDTFKTIMAYWQKSQHPKRVD